MGKILVNLLFKVLKGKKFNFSIDTDRDGVAILEGKVNLEELGDEIRKKIS